MTNLHSTLELAVANSTALVYLIFFFSVLSFAGFAFTILLIMSQLLQLCLRSLPFIALRILTAQNFTRN